MTKDNLQMTWEDDKIESTPKYDRRDTVYAMWEGGIRDVVMISDETGYSPNYVRKLLSDRGYSVATAHIRPRSEVDQIVAAYLSDERVKDILKKYKISNNTLYGILEAEGVPTRKDTPERHRGRARFIERAIEMYQQDVLLKDIINETGITATTLYQELAVRNIPTSRGANGGKSNPVLEKAIEMYTSGAGIIDIQLETGVPLTRLYKEIDIRQLGKRRNKDADKRVDAAVEMYVTTNATLDDIYEATKVGSTMLYRALRQKGIDKRGDRREGRYEKALEMYDKGSTAKEIMKVSGVSLAEMIKLLKSRGENLRTGLIPSYTPRNLEYAIQGYKQGIDVDTIEIDTFITRTRLYAELKSRGIELRP
jgi:hypothetical protein